MSGSEQDDRVALVSVDNQATIGGLENRNKLGTDLGEGQTVQEPAQGVLRRVTEYTKLANILPRVHDHLALIITLQMVIMDLQAEQFLLPQCGQTKMEKRIRGLEIDLTEVQTRPAVNGADEQLREDLLGMSQDTQQSGEEVRGVMMQLANAITFAVWVAPPAPQTPEDWGQKFPDSLDFSESDPTQLRGWTAQLQIVIRHKPTSNPEEQSKLRYTLNRLMGTALGQILVHVRENRTIGLEDLPALIQLLEAACGDPDGVATTERKMRVIQQKNRELSQNFAEFQVIAAHQDRNPSALQNALRMGLFDDMKDSFAYSDLPKELAVFVTVCQKQDNQIRQWRVEMAAQKEGGGTGLASWPRSPAPPKDPSGAPAGPGAGYTPPAPVDLRRGRITVSAEEGVKRIADGRCLYRGGFNQKAQMFMAAGAEVKEVGTGTGSEELGKD